MSVNERNRRRWMPWAWAGLIWLLLSLPSGLVPEGEAMESWLPLWLQAPLEAWGDKLVHAGLFAVLAVLTWHSRPRRWRVGFLWCAAYAALTELYHLLLPYRSAEWGDVAADFSGIALVAVLVLLGSSSDDS
jgi:hypothetical protein